MSNLTSIIFKVSLTFFLLFSFSQLSAQKVIVTGTVKDEAGELLPNVTIKIEETQNVVLSDIKGQFRVETSKGNTLQFSYVGMSDQRIRIEKPVDLSIVLNVNRNSLSNVVVVGYGKEKRANLIGSVATLNTKETKDIPVGNISNSLIGRLPGLMAVNRGGAPGDDASQISIRGFDNMLVIVDGVPNQFDNIDPNEIESISILKDASASIYGSRAGNGVMLITTKRGKIGKPLINFNGYYGLQSPTIIPRQVDAPTYARMVNEANIAAGTQPIYTDAEIQKYKDGTDPNYPNTNWYNQVFKANAPISLYNINTSGGGERVKYFFSLGYLNQDGLFKSGDLNYDRYNLRSNIDANISKSLSISLDLGARMEQRNQPGGTVPQVLEDLTFSQPTYVAHYPDPTKLAYTGHIATQPIGRSTSSFSGYSNDDRKYFNPILTFKYDFNFLKGLSAKALFSYNTYDDYNKTFDKQFSIYTYDKTSNEYSLLGYGQNSKTQLDEQYSRASNLFSQFIINYNKKIGKNEIDAVLISEVSKSDSNYFSAHREGFLTTTIDQLFAGSDLNKDNNGSASEDGRTSYAGRVHYAFNEKYLVEMSMRADASARYAPGKQWGYFPSFSAGWKISKENFMKHLNFISNLKLRASYGKAGNDYVGMFNYVTGYYFGGNNVFGESPTINKGIVSKGLANPNLTWESTSISNLGLDGSLWNSFLDFQLDVFYRKVTNVAGYRYLSLPSTFGATLPLENLNSFDDRGFELVVSNEEKFNAFKLSIQGNITYARSKWIHFDEPAFSDPATKQRLQQSGQWKNRFFGYQALGLFQSQEEINKWPVIQDGNGNKTLKPGDIKYADFNGDGILDEKDMHVIGRGFTPEIYFGLNVDLAYKNFDVSLLLQGAADNNAYFGAYITQPFQNGNVPYSYLSDYWTPQNTGAKYPRIYPGGAPNNAYISSYWLQNADYVRLKNIQIGYTMPKKILSKEGISSVRFYIAAYNILTLDKVQPFDPETGNRNNGQFYPQQKSINFGFNVSL